MYPLPVFLFFGLLAATPADADDPVRESMSDQVLSRYLAASKRNVVRSISMVTVFSGGVPKLGKQGTLTARRMVAADGKIEYEVISSEGDNTIKKEVIARYISAETEGPAQAAAGGGTMAITPENYKFKYKGSIETDGVKVYLFEVNPRKKRVGLFKGEIWVDAETGLGVRESGRLVKSPSVFLKNVEFIREFKIVNESALPERMETVMETRFWGKAKLEVKYSDWLWDTPPVTQAVLP